MQNIWASTVNPMETLLKQTGDNGPGHKNGGRPLLWSFRIHGQSAYSQKSCKFYANRLLTALGEIGMGIRFLSNSTISFTVSAPSESVSIAYPDDSVIFHHFNRIAVV